jgi:hypothetical protein
MYDLYEEDLRNTRPYPEPRVMHVSTCIVKYDDGGKRKYVICVILSET